MIRLYPIIKKTVFQLTIAFAFFSNSASAQNCPPIIEDFNNTGGTMAGFSSSTQGSTAPGFVYGQTGANGYLQRCNFPNASITYQIVTRTFATLPTQTFIGFGIDLSGQVQSDLVYVFMDYFNDITSTVKSAYIFAATPQYVNGTATVCLNINVDSIPGFDAGDAYRFNIFVRNATASGPNQCIVLDNFRTSGNPTSIILPVTFTNIVARKTKSDVELVWNVAGEKEVSHYEIERSSDATNFAKVGEVTASGLSAYTFTDKRTTGKEAYYRVRNVDVDGKFSYSKVVRVNLSTNAALSIYPQPVKTDLTIEHSSSLNGKIIISSASGHVVKLVTMKVGDTLTNVNVSTLTPGLYIVRYDDGQGKVETLKMIKQ